MSIRSPSAPRGGGVRTPLASRWWPFRRPLTWVGGGMLALLAGVLSLATGDATLVLVSPLAASTPIIHWDPGMIYTGQNHDLPWGPVGMLVSVDGARFTPGQRVSVVVVPGNSNQNPTACQSSPVTVGNGTADDQGAFTVAFSWPTDAAQVNNAYSVCSFAGINDVVLSTANDGPFTVLASSAPILRLTPRSVAPGGTVTISGSGWVPPQTVEVAVTAGGGRPPLVTGTATSTGQNTGVFSIKLKIPASAPAGTYGIAASAKDGRLSAAAPGSLTITALTPTTTPTPTHTATVTPTHAATVTPTTAPTLAPTHAPTSAPTTTPSTVANSASNSTPNWPVIGLSIAVGLLLLTVAGLLGLLFFRRRHEHDGGAPSAAAPWPMPQPRPAVPVPSGQAMPDPRYPDPRYPETGGWRPLDPNQPYAREGYPPAEYYSAGYPPQQYAAPEAWQGHEAYQNPASGPYQEPYPGPYQAPYQGRPPEAQPYSQPAYGQAYEGGSPATEPRSPARDVTGYGPPYGPYTPRPPSQPTGAQRAVTPPGGQQTPPPPDAYGMPGPWRLDPDSQPRESPFSGPIQGAPPWSPPPQQPPPQWRPEDQPPPAERRPVPHGPYDPNDW